MNEPVTFLSMLGGFAALTYFIIRFTVTKVWTAFERRGAEEAAWMREQMERQTALTENHLSHNTEAVNDLRTAISELVALLRGQRGAAT